MKHSAGILISTIIEGVTKYLFCHPTSASWKGTYSIPKGEYKPEEELSRDAAIRETEEETSVLIFTTDIINMDNPILIPYVSKTGKLHKDVIVYKAPFILENNKFILEKDYTIKKDFLQLEEVDWAGFLAPWELADKVFWRFKFLVMNIDHLFGKVIESIPISLEIDGKGYIASTNKGLTEYSYGDTAKTAYCQLQTNIETLYTQLQETNNNELSDEFIQKKKYFNTLIKG